MGPTIILDKSAYQSLSKDDTFELSRYFYVVVPPVLILEILADLKKPKMPPGEAQAVVMGLARKIQPVDGYVNANYRTLCTANLLGAPVKMDRRPIVAGARRVVAENGTVGSFLDMQPEKEALLRWSCGRFDEAEQSLAAKWRAASQEVDLEAFQRQLLALGEWVPLTSLARVRQVVDEMIALPEAQLPFLETMLRELRPLPEVEERTLSRWRNGSFSCFRKFAGYAQHCSRVGILFQLALVHRLIGTRSTNRIDMEYFYYSPFAHVFCSGDGLHRALAEVILSQDQSFVWHDELRGALRAVADARTRARESGADDAHGLQPEENSLIRRLWIKHLGHWPSTYPGAAPSPPDAAKEKELMSELKPMMDAVRKAQRESTPRPKWPCP